MRRQPYAAGSKPLKNLLPQWMQDGGQETMLERLASPDAQVARKFIHPAAMAPSMSVRSQPGAR